MRIIYPTGLEVKTNKLATFACQVSIHHLMSPSKFLQKKKKKEKLALLFLQKELESEKTYEDGSTYTGQFKAELRHGTGTQTWKDGSTYVGEWQNDM